MYFLYCAVHVQCCTYIQMYICTLSLVFRTVVLYIAQDPSWYPSLSSRQELLSQETQEMDLGEGGGEGGREGIKRQLSTESSSPDVVCPPPRKRKRLTSSSSVSVLHIHTVHVCTCTYYTCTCTCIICMVIFYIYMYMYTNVLC